MVYGSRLGLFGAGAGAGFHFAPLEGRPPAAEDRGDADRMVTDESSSEEASDGNSSSSNSEGEALSMLGVAGAWSAYGAGDSDGTADDEARDGLAVAEV